MTMDSIKLIEIPHVVKIFVERLRREVAQCSISPRRSPSSLIDNGSTGLPDSEGDPVIILRRIGIENTLLEDFGLQSMC